MENIISWICIAVVFATICIFASSGEILTEKSGHLNLGVPGIMYLSGFVSYYSVYNYEKASENPSVIVIFLIAIFTALLVGGILGALYSIMCVTFKCNQNVMGLIITSFGIGFGKFLSSISNLTDTKAIVSGEFFSARIPGLKSIPFIGDLLFNYGIMTYIAIIVAVLLMLFFNKTRIGLNLRAVGESTKVADAAGINVTAYKYVATIVGCSLCGIAGMVYVLQYGGGLWSTNNNIEAIGWLAIALVIFVSWRPIRLLWSAVLFGALFWTYNYLPVLLPAITFAGSSELIKMLPYVVTIIVLIVNSVKKSKLNQPPSSLGLSYFREER